MDEHANRNLTLFPRLSTEVTHRDGARHLARRRLGFTRILSETGRDAGIGNNDLFIVDVEFRRMLAEVFSDHLGHEQEVVVVYDDQVSRLVNLGNPFSKEFVGCLVVHPHGIRGGSRDGGVLPEQVVEKGPKSCRGAVSKNYKLPKTLTYWSYSNPHSDLELPPAAQTQAHTTSCPPRPF